MKTIIVVATQGIGLSRRKHITFDPKKHKVSGGFLWQGDKNLGVIKEIYSE